MRGATAFLFILFSIPFSITNANAQLKELKSGDTVKIIAPSINADTLVGTIDELTSNALVVNQSAYQVEIPWNAIIQLEIRREHHPAGKGALIGAGSGGLIMGLLLMSADESCSSSDEFCIDLVKPGEALLAGALVGGFIGGFTGLIIGGLITEVRWEPMDLHFSLSTNHFRLPQNNFASGIAIRLSF